MMLVMVMLMVVDFDDNDNQQIPKINGVHILTTKIRGQLEARATD